MWDLEEIKQMNERPENYKPEQMKSKEDLFIEAFRQAFQSVKRQEALSCLCQNWENWDLLKKEKK